MHPGSTLLTQLSVSPLPPPASPPLSTPAALSDDYPVTKESYFNNSMLAYHFRQIFKLSKLGRPVDRHEWSMRASTVNAYYDNGVTALFVPAAVLQVREEEGAGELE